MFFITDIFGVQRGQKSIIYIYIYIYIYIHIYIHTYIYFVGLSLTLGKVTQISKGTPVKWDNKACKIYSTEKVTYQFYCVSNF